MLWVDDTLLKRRMLTHKQCPGSRRYGYDRRKGSAISRDTISEVFSATRHCQRCVLFVERRGYFLDVCMLRCRWREKSKLILNQSTDTNLTEE
jgi:primosomal protein N'